MSRRWSITILAALGLSLAVNLFFAGAMAARAWRPGPEGRFARIATMSSLGPGAPQELRERIERQVESERDTIRDELRGARRARAEVREAIRAEPLDLARLDAAFVALRASHDRLQATLHQAVARAISAAPAAERARLPPPRRRDRD